MSPRLHRRAAGFTLVELMVGMLIGLIGIVIMTHLYITNDRFKRSTAGSGTAQVNGAVALYTLERDIRMSGWGINHTGALECSCPLPPQPGCSPVQYYYTDARMSFPPAGSAAGALPARAAVPLVIFDNPVGPDTITVLSSTANERLIPAALKEDTIAPNHDYVAPLEGFQDGNLILVSQGGTCVLRQISKVQSGSSTLEHRSGPFDPAASFGPKFNAGAAVFNLGTNPVWRTFSVANNRLQVEDVLRSLQLGVPAIQPLVDDVVDLQAQYGKDDGTGGATAADGTIDVWNTVQPADAVAWSQVLAVRIAVLVRSDNYEKPSVAGGPCEATTAANPPQWAGGTLTVPGGLPSCYRHRVFQTVIPLRNMIWRPS